MPEFKMHRNGDDEWPDDVPPGTFDIIGVAPGDQRMLFVCPNRQRCAVNLKPCSREGATAWAWDGNEESPTLSPSINCVGGCGWHGFVQNGVMR